MYDVDTPANAYVCNLIRNYNITLLLQVYSTIKSYILTVYYNYSLTEIRYVEFREFLAVTSPPVPHHKTILISQSNSKRALTPDITLLM